MVSSWKGVFSCCCCFYLLPNNHVCNTGEITCFFLGLTFLFSNISLDCHDQSKICQVKDLWNLWNTNLSHEDVYLSIVYHMEAENWKKHRCPKGVHCWNINIMGLPSVGLWTMKTIGPMRMKLFFYCWMINLSAPKSNTCHIIGVWFLLKKKWMNQFCKLIFKGYPGRMPPDYCFAAWQIQADQKS